MSQIAKTYQPQLYEAKIYDLWQRSGAFNPNNQTTAGIKTFSIIMPPPNANGKLHIGHAVFVALQDLMIRYHRMRQQPTLWLPGFDHAGFETQVVFDKKLEQEGKNRLTIEPSRLYDQILEFTQINKKEIENQLRRLGASCDWSRQKFTLDPDVVSFVYQTFQRMYEAGLAYRAPGLVNWCVKHQTALSDLEVRYVERTDPLYYLKYGLFTIATTRPETKFGDKYVVVHPKDSRYNKYQDGQVFGLEWINGPIKATLLKDELIDMKFGSGAMTITPAHDRADFELAVRRGLEIEPVIDSQGKLGPIAGGLTGTRASQSRPKIIQLLQAKGLVERIDTSYRHSLSVCYKCQRPIEPLVREQWFISMHRQAKIKIKNVSIKKALRRSVSLQQLGLAALDTGQVRFVTKRFEKVYRHWLSNLRDWNISRQIVWGIPIPAWYCQDALKRKSQSSNSSLQPGRPAGQTNQKCRPIVSIGQAPKKCPDCGSSRLTRDQDVFDTWFSSGQWPFAALLASGANPKSQIKNPKQSADFERFYPTSVMETGHDIIFFWVARMIMLGLFSTGEVPFRQVYLHGLVRDQDRQKMSKSKGNVIDPLGVIEDFGADALRLALVFGTAAGSDIVISEQKIRGMRNFANKLWNVARFIMISLKQSQADPNKIKNLDLQRSNLTKADLALIKALDQTVRKTTQQIESFRFHQAAQQIYDFVWHDLADSYIERSKKQLTQAKLTQPTQAILLRSLSSSLALLHPFMPFVTEAIWQELRQAGWIDNDLLISHDWPQPIN